MTLSMYREAFEHHATKCDQCDEMRMRLCHVGGKLLDAWAQACAKLMAPIPVIPRGKAQA